MSTAPVSTSLVACRNVSVTFGRGRTAVHALSNINASIERGEHLSLCGRSGSGKTTLLHVLGGLVSPADGEVLLGGTHLSSLDAAARGAARARAIAYVFQGANLLPTFTAFENVAFARHVSNAQDGPDPAELLELVGLRAKLDALPPELSGGEAQRVAIARALAQQPQLLLCDEPTGQLDSDTSTRVLDLIEALRTKLSFALVLATHDAEVAARAGRVIMLDDGRIVSDQQLEAA